MDAKVVRFPIPVILKILSWSSIFLIDGFMAEYKHKIKMWVLEIWLDGLALMSVKGSADVACDDEYGIVG